MVQKINPHPAPGCNRSPPPLLCIFKRCNSWECSVHFFRGPWLKSMNFYHKFTIFTYLCTCTCTMINFLRIFKIIAWNFKCPKGIALSMTKRSWRLETPLPEFRNELKISANWSNKNLLVNQAWKETFSR